MNILILSFDFPPKLGGVANCAYNVAKELSSNHKNKVLVIARKLEAIPKENDDKILPENFNLKRVYLPKVALFTVPFFMYHILISIFSFRPSKILSMLWMPSGLSIFFLYPILKIKKIKYYIYVHAVEVLESSSSFKKIIRKLILGRLKKYVFKYAEKIIAVSNFTKDLVIKNCEVKDDNIEVINNGVDTNSFFIKTIDKNNTLKEISLKYPDALKLLTISRLVPNKGIDTVLKACHILKQQNVNFVYLIGGVGPDCNRLKKIVLDLNLEDNVVFLNKLPEVELVDFYNWADIYLLISRYDKEKPLVEGFGLVFLEAAACKTTSIGGDSGGIPDAISKESGLLVDPYDFESLAKQVSKLNKDRRLIDELSSNAYSRALNSFTWKIQVDRLNKILLR